MDVLVGQVHAGCGEKTKQTFRDAQCSWGKPYFQPVLANIAVHSGTNYIIKQVIIMVLTKLFRHKLQIQALRSWMMLPGVWTQFHYNQTAS